MEWKIPHRFSGLIEGRSWDGKDRMGQHCYVTWTVALRRLSSQDVDRQLPMSVCGNNLSFAVHPI